MSTISSETSGQGPML